MDGPPSGAENDACDPKPTSIELLEPLEIHSSEANFLLYF